MTLAGAGTSPLKRHLKRKHNILVNEPKKPRRLCEDQEKITRALCKWIIRDRLPLSCVSHGLPDFLGEVVPEFKVPNRATIKRMVMGMTTSLRADLANVISKVKFLSITVDTWTSRANDSYLIVTGHWLTELFEKRNCTLGVKHLTESHTGDYLSAMVMSVLTDLNFQGTVVSNTHDGASNITKGLSVNHGQSLQCSAHLLNLVVVNVFAGVPDLRDIQSRCRHITTFFNKSSHATAELFAAQRRLGVRELKVRPDVSTRWNSFYMMIERLVELKSPISEILGNHRKLKIRLLQLTPLEWSIVEDLVSLFKPLDDATKILSGENYSTLGLVHMVFHLIIAKVTELITPSEHRQPSDCCIAIGNVIIDNVRRRCKAASPLEIASILLDPRVKSMKHLPPPKRRTFDIRLELFAEEFHTKVGTVLERKQPHLEDDLLSQPPREEISLLKEIQSEISRWLTEPEQPIRFLVNGEFVYTDAANYWQLVASKYPLLAPIAQQALASPGTSVPCERVCSVVGAMVSYRRARMAPDFVEGMILGSMNWSLLTEARELEHDENAGDLFFDSDVDIDVDVEDIIPSPPRSPLAQGDRKSVV